MALTAQDSRRLTDRLRDRMRQAGFVPDRYDPDFIMGVLMEWLGENNAALTKDGVRRFRRDR